MVKNVIHNFTNSYSLEITSCVSRRSCSFYYTAAFSYNFTSLDRRRNVALDQSFSTWMSFPFLAFDKNIHNFVYILCFVCGIIFVVADIIGSPFLEKLKAYSFIQYCFKYDYDHYSVLSVIMTITGLLPLATHEYHCDVIMSCVCKLDILTR